MSNGINHPIDFCRPMDFLSFPPHIHTQIHHFHYFHHHFHQIHDSSYLANLLNIHLD